MEEFVGAAGCRLSSAGSRFQFRLIQRPRKPATTNQAPATIIQCGYSISESTSFPLHLQPELDQAALIQNVLARANGLHGSFQPTSDQILVHSRIEQRQKLFVLRGRPRSSGW